MFATFRRNNDGSDLPGKQLAAKLRESLAVTRQADVKLPPGVVGR
jgi:hypothetical protein